MNNDNNTILGFDVNLICDFFLNTERQGPGSPEVTLKALSFIDNLTNKSLIADLGCGTGGPLDSKVVRRIPEPEEEDTDTPEGNTSETVSGASAPTAEKTDVDIQTTTGKESAGFWRKKIALPDFERTFFAPVDCRNRSAIYVSARTKHKVSEILHLLGNESTRLTALVDNMLRFVLDIYSDELNYLHEKKNNRRPF